jgi:hypothetical protein
MAEIDVRAIADGQLAAVKIWHDSDDESLPHGGTGIEGVVLDQNRFNYRLWHQEDQARRSDVGDEVIARVKRTIDGLNQLRNDHIEKIDEAILEDLKAKAVEPGDDSELNTETPGSAFDRLSISALRIHHMLEELERDDVDDEHSSQVRNNLARVELQRSDLINSLSSLLESIYAGRKVLRVYRQMKMYNDPKLNPAVYGAGES